ncbi:hypothetical protein BGX24_002910, partial [Mortierella sp. AD032]
SLLVLTLSLLLSPLAANVVSADPQQPPAPQPANGGGSTPTNNPVAAPGDAAKTDSGSKPTITSSGGGTASGASTITDAPPQPTVISTVTVINGTTTTVSITVTPAGGGGLPAAAVPTTLPKAPQSIIVIQDTPYGKVLPAAGPPDDVIESHFWDQYVPHEGGPKSSSASTGAVSAIITGAGGGWRQYVSLFLVHSIALWAVAVALELAL